MWPRSGLGSEDVAICVSISLNPGAKVSSVSDRVSSVCFDRKVDMLQKATCRQSSLDHSPSQIL